MTTTPAATDILDTILPTPATIGSSPLSTAEVIAAMLDSGKGISDLIFSPGRPPQVEKHGELIPVAVPDLPLL